MTSFAFYGRVSTEDQQDPEASRGWQLARAEALIHPAGGAVVEEFFDIGQSRSLPWKRRPEAARLLDSIAGTERTWDAVVIGEPQRAFYGDQFTQTFPVLTHYGVSLWVPEIGGRVDPGSEAHDLVMMLFGGMSKGERNRVKVRVRSAMAQQATQGRFLGGRPPYGYHLADDGPHPNPSKAAAGQRQHRLEADDATAPIVRRIFEEYLGGRGLYAIAEGLTADGVPCPSAADRARNRHRSGIAWSKGAIRTILRNPRYTGRGVWNRQSRDEQLIDVEDVAMGHRTKQVWNDQADWVWSTELAHEPVIDVETYTRAQQIASAGAGRPAKQISRRRNPYLLRGLMLCSSCGRRMQGSFNHGQAHYRCKLPSEYALANKVDHPPTIYLKESAVVPALDEWIASVFDPSNLDATCDALAAAQGPADQDVARAEAAVRQLEDCDKRLAKYRAALDAGADATVVAGWMAEVQGEKLRAEQDLLRSKPAASFDADAIRSLIEELGPMEEVLAGASYEAKAELYNSLGLELTFDAGQKVVTVEAAPVYSGSCRRGVQTPEYTTVLRGVLSL